MFTNFFTFIFQYASRDKSHGYVQISSDKSIIILIILVIIIALEKAAKYPINVQIVKSNYCLRTILCMYHGN